jgi:hypothetical protein
LLYKNIKTIKIIPHLLPLPSGERGRVRGKNSNERR